jgi:hypothetical protein
MFTSEAIIDAVQTGKKTWINTFVTNATVKEAMVNFVDTQADYTKKAARVGQDTVTVLTNEMVKTIQQSTKFDYTKFGDGIMKAYQTTQKPAKGA